MKIDVEIVKDRVSVAKVSWENNEEFAKAMGLDDIGDFSDGYHTFNDLYHQRAVLFAALVKAHKDKAWKSWKHEDDKECFGGGWFSVKLTKSHQSSSKIISLLFAPPILTIPGVT